MIQPQFTAQKLHWTLAKLLPQISHMMADIWPVGNIWSIDREMVNSKKPKNKAQLKTILPRVWREINSDKALCKRLMKSIPPGLKL